MPSPEHARGDTVADDTCDSDSLRGPLGAVRVDGACTMFSIFMLRT